MAVLFRKMIVVLDNGPETLKDNDDRELLFIKESDFATMANFLGYPGADQEIESILFDDVEEGPEIIGIQTYVKKAKKDEETTGE